MNEAINETNDHGYILGQYNNSFGSILKEIILSLSVA